MLILLRVSQTFRLSSGSATAYKIPWEASGCRMFLRFPAQAVNTLRRQAKLEVRWLKCWLMQNERECCRKCCNLADKSVMQNKR